MLSKKTLCINIQVALRFFPLAGATGFTGHLRHRMRHHPEIELDNIAIHLCDWLNSICSSQSSTQQPCSGTETAKGIQRNPKESSYSPHTSNCSQNTIHILGRAHPLSSIAHKRIDFFLPFSSSSAAAMSL